MALALRPRHPKASLLLGGLLCQNGDVDVGLVHLEVAREAGLPAPDVALESGILLAKQGQLMAAERCFQAAVEWRPGMSEARNNLANTLYLQQRYAEAAEHYQRVVAKDSGHWRAAFNLGRCRYVLGDWRDAETLFRRAVALAPDLAEPRAQLAVLLEEDNRPDAAERLAREALAIEAGNGDALLVLARVDLRHGRPQAALDRLEPIDSSPLSDAKATAILALRGRALDALGRFGEAFAAFEQSKQRRGRRSPGFDPTTMVGQVDGVEAWFSAERLGRLGLPVTAAAASPLPVFIVGFFRSGTTLLHQMLGCHTEIAACGELPLLPRAERYLTQRLDGSYPGGLEGLTTSQVYDLLGAARKQYLHDVGELPGVTPRHRWVVDKHPFNSVRLALIQLLFPDAPVIYMVRHPLDVLLSNFFTDYADAHGWSHSMADIATLVARSHRHLRCMTPRMGNAPILVRYEDLVDDPEAELRRVLDRIGAHWEPRCLRFQDNPSVPRTASYAQISRPLYRDSRYRHLHYREFIDPAVIDVIAPMTKELGYAL